MPTHEIGLQVENLCVSYQGVPAVRGVDLEVKAGEAIGLIGPNGAGKSSTLLGIMGATARTGTVRINGIDVAGLPPEKVVRQGVALVPEGASLPGSRLLSRLVEPATELARYVPLFSSRLDRPSPDKSAAASAEF